MRWLVKTFLLLPRCRRILWGSLALLCACAFVPHQSEWIIVGHTTREEVVDAYGEPDLVLAATEGETVVYRPQAVSHSRSLMKIPTARVAPHGMVTTQMEPVAPRLGASPINGAPRMKLERELRIRYDGQGIVREVIP